MPRKALDGLNCHGGRAIAELNKMLLCVYRLHERSLVRQLARRLEFNRGERDRNAIHVQALGPVIGDRIARNSYNSLRQEMSSVGATVGDDIPTRR